MSRHAGKMYLFTRISFAHYDCNRSVRLRMLLKKFSPFLISALPSALGIALLALPLAPSIYWLTWYGHRCFDGSGPVSPDSAPLCLVKSALSAPFVFLLGPLAHDDESPLVIWPGVFLTALIIGASFAMIRAYRSYSRSVVK